MKNMNNKPKSTLMNKKSKSTLMIILGFLFLLAAGIVADTTNLYWTSFACLVISIINLFFGFGILIGAPIIEWNIIMNKPQWPTLQDRLNHPLKDELTALQQLKQVLPLSKQAQELYDKLSKESIQETRSDAGTTRNEGGISKNV